MIWCFGQPARHKVQLSIFPTYFMGGVYFLAQKHFQPQSALRPIARRSAPCIDHFRGAGVEASVLDAVGGGYHRVRRPDPGEWSRITAVIPTRDRADLLRTAVQGLREKTDYPELEIIIVDNETKEVESLRYLSELEHQGIRVLRVPGPFNYSLMNNLAVAEASGELVLLLNNDTEVIEPGWLKEMTRYFQEKRVAVVGPKLLYPDGTLQHGGVVLGIGGVAGHIHVGEPRNSGGYFGRLWLAQDVSCVTGACMLVRRSVFEKVCGFDSESLPVAFNDVDFCLRVVKAGWRIIWTPSAVLYHHESKSRGGDTSGEKLTRFQRDITTMRARWGEALTSDPFYNPNLSLESCTPRLAAVPRIKKPWLSQTLKTRSIGRSE